MTQAERTNVITALAYMGVYIPYFLVQVGRAASGAQISLWAIFPFHFLGMGLNLAAFIVTIRDLYLRPFATPERKADMAFTDIADWRYRVARDLFKHAFKPRTYDNAP